MLNEDAFQKRSLRWSVGWQEVPADGTSEAELNAQSPHVDDSEGEAHHPSPSSRALLRAKNSFRFQLCRSLSEISRQLAGSSP
ncbi:hypothetical protein CEXT_43861 [Caerostris extrusa]|uniref:Uncharacterized protein n=1 Tax=Caerostris extrusa TaxID=172846 RepID=A0AAV4Y0R1_CAEEX|nr:hypothetical protein CEXT_43861 [Caerostris extrusa]